MREKVVAGNWKMNNTLREALELINDLTKSEKKQPIPGVRLVVAPPSTFVRSVVKATNDSPFEVAAQNCHHEPKGAYTGEVSAAMVKSTGANYVILGHSERRAYFHETNEQLARKVDLALEHDLIPIFCCGEQLEEREKGIHFEVIESQLREALFHLEVHQMERIIIAYEPVWAIGTGLTATPEQAQEVHAHIRQLLANQYAQDLADNTSILYGGSCKPSNAQSLFVQPDVDGGLIGGASLKAADFLAIAQSF